MELIAIREGSFLSTFVIGNSCVQIVRIKLINRINFLNKPPNLLNKRGASSFFYFFSVEKWCRTDFHGEAPDKGEDNSCSSSKQENSLGPVPQPPLSTRLLPQG